MAAASNLSRSDFHVISRWRFLPKSMKSRDFCISFHTLYSQFRSQQSQSTIHKHCCTVIAALVTVVELRSLSVIPCDADPHQ